MECTRLLLAFNFCCSTQRRTSKDDGGSIMIGEEISLEILPNWLHLVNLCVFRVFDEGPCEWFHLQRINIQVSPLSFDLHQKITVLILDRFSLSLLVFAQKYKTSQVVFRFSLSHFPNLHPSNLNYLRLRVSASSSKHTRSDENEWKSIESLFSWRLRSGCELEEFRTFIFFDWLVVIMCVRSPR